jgi:hypothetical protein
MEPTH